MKACTGMQAVIEQLAEKHDVDLSTEGAVLQLDMAGYLTLYIGNAGPNCMVVAHYREEPEFVQTDPEVVFFVNRSMGWIPIRVTMAVGGSREYARLSEDADEIVAINTKSQADLADFVEKVWVTNLRLQEWLECAEARPKERQIHRSSRPMLFPLGRVVATPGALAALEAADQKPQEFLDRHCAGDWGELPEEDIAANEQALIHGSRVFSGYSLSNGTRMWIITEADRSATTLLLPSEY